MVVEVIDLKLIQVEIVVGYIVEVGEENNIKVVLRVWLLESLRILDIPNIMLSL